MHHDRPTQQTHRGHVSALDHGSFSPCPGVLRRTYHRRMERSAAEVIEVALGKRPADSTPATWGFQNRTDLVTLSDGDRVVLQRYRNRADARRRLQVIWALREPAGQVGIPLAGIRQFDLDAEPAWIIYDALPGVPVAAAGGVGPGGPQFPVMARAMGELLAAFRGLPTASLDLDSLWSDPHRLAAEGWRWADQVPELRSTGHPALRLVLDGLPPLFAGRPAVLAHGDFAPVNILTDGARITGLLDFESVRLADPLFDPAWWAWSVSFAGSAALEGVWPAFLDAAGVEPADGNLSERVKVLQILRMLELLASRAGISPQTRNIVTERLRTTLE
jgi:aminoglycoside phosphotransferase (APT) family kinase protein